MTWIITQGMRSHSRGVDLDWFDVLTDEIGLPIKFDTEVSAWGFVRSSNMLDVNYLDAGEVNVEQLQ